MATEASRITVIINAMTETLQFLKEHPENLNFLDPLLPAFRIARRAIANFGKELPEKDREWCQKWQTIEHADEATPDATMQDNTLTADAVTQTIPSTTDTTTQDGSATTDAATQDNSSTADAAMADAAPADAAMADAAPADAVAAGSCSTTDAITQDVSSTAVTEDHTFATQGTSIVNKKQHNYQIGLIYDEVIAKFKG
jgi:hypothetical protein